MLKAIWDTFYYVTSIGGCRSVSLSQAWGCHDGPDRPQPCPSRGLCSLVGDTQLIQDVYFQVQFLEDSV